MTDLKKKSRTVNNHEQSNDLFSAVKIMLIIALIFGVSACSGFLPSSLSKGGKIVSPDYLAQYEGGGSLSSLWYRGSDDKYHYFVHYVKISTRYRILRDKLVWMDEFQIGNNQKPILVNNELSSYVEKGL